MTFTDRAILTGLVLLAIPVLVHLLGRRRPRRVELPTARFAEGAHAAAWGRVWLKRAALLALRLAAVALAVLVLAGPRLGGGAGDAGGRWAFVLDASPSMQATDGGRSAPERAGRSAFERAKEAMERVLGRLDPSAGVMLALSDGRGAEGAPAEIGRMLEALAGPSWRSDPLGGTIRDVLARHAAAGGGEPLRLVIATDATPAALADIHPGAFAEADADVTIQVVPSAASRGNASLGLPAVRVEPARDGPGRLLTISADARGRRDDDEFRVRVRVAEVALAATSGTFTGQGRATFRLSVPADGPWQGLVILEGDPGALTVDNVRYFTAAARPVVAVLVVDAADEAGARVRSADLVSAALAGETDVAKTVATRRAGEVAEADLASADVVFWVGPAGPPAGVSLGARRGALVWVPADAAPPGPALAEAVGLAGATVEATPDGATIDPAGYTSDLLAAFEGGTSGDLSAPVFRQRLRAEEGAGESPGRVRRLGRTDGPGHAESVVVRFRDGAPAIQEQRDGPARAVALAFGPAPAWGDLAGRPEWVVLVHSLAEALGPAGDVRTLNLTMAEAVRAALPGFRGEPGNYQGADAQGRPVRYSVNVDPAETADLTPEPRRLAAAFPKGRVHVETDGLGAKTAISGPQGSSGTDLTPYLVAALAAVLALEGAVAWWASPRRGQ